MNETMDTLETIQYWLEDEYNDHLTTYIRENKVQLTNGSAGYYLYIWKEDHRLKIAGELYGRSVSKVAQNNRESLINVLSHTI